MDEEARLNNQSTFYLLGYVQGSLEILEIEHPDNIGIKNAIIAMKILERRTDKGEQIK